MKSLAIVRDKTGYLGFFVPAFADENRLQDPS